MKKNYLVPHTEQLVLQSSPMMWDFSNAPEPWAGPAYRPGAIFYDN